MTPQSIRFTVREDAAAQGRTKLDRPVGSFGPHVVEFRITSPLAFLLLGTQRLATPLPGDCWLHNEVLIALPVAIANGTAQAQFDPLPFPGLAFTVQGATFDPAVPLVRTSRGLAFTCR